MDRKPIKNNSNLRALALTSALAIITILAAIDLAYLTHILGHLLLLVALGVLTVIFMTCEKTVFALNAAALVIILFFASGKSVLLALFGAVLVLGAMLLALAVWKKSAKTSAVLTVSITVALGYLVSLALVYAASGNSLAPADLFEKLNAAFDAFKVPLADVIRESVDSLSEEMLAYYAKYDITKEILLETSLATMEAFFDMVQLLLPGCFVFLVQTMAYIGVSSFEKMTRIIRYDVLLPEVRWRLYPTQISCIVYIVVTSLYLLASFFAPTSAFVIIITNFWIALMPVMIACGCNGLIMRLKHPRFRRSMIFILILFSAGCIFMTDIALSFGVFMLTFMGAQDVSLARSAEALEKKNRDRS